VNASEEPGGNLWKSCFTLFTLIRENLTLTSSVNGERERERIIEVIERGEF